MSQTNWAEEKTTIVVPASTKHYIEGRQIAAKWLVFAVCALVAVMMSVMWITPSAFGDDSGTSSDGNDNGVTITENITDTENLLGSHAAEVSDAIAQTEKDTGVHVHLLYLSSFNSEQTPEDWARNVLESTDPKPNTVMLAVASNDGNLVVAVSKNSDEWLKKKDTVDKLSAVAQQPLMESTPNWSQSAIALMDQIAKSKKTSTSSSAVRIGVIVMGVALAVLVLIIVVTVLIRHRKKIAKSAKTELQDDIQETPRRARHSRKHE
ncbi:hypothetical protein G1C97_0415 [Bifidobacterium sp. DSM 109959]|uniref:TPM domain-containing protein n=2 Tax=Bifidobacterium olomucense TaxID=2675324 RepID=A0A7Y0EY50_9BIFI|nr:TPM domain-containing protein [Bifidobacterium sp. DSM 109959]NMM97466.1 hypothetical protein [Bifidobacterium sp. DSM 109959]